MAVLTLLTSNNPLLGELPFFTLQRVIFLMVIYMVFMLIFRRCDRQEVLIMKEWSLN